MRRITLISALLIVLECGFSWAGESSFGRPGAKDTIANREDFPVSVAVADYDKDRAAGYHFWVSIAMGHDNPSQHWPKFYVKTAQYEARASDGGSNPLPTKQAMTILLLRVDGARNQQFVRWLEQAHRTRVNPAFNVVKDEVIGRLPIFFP